MKSALIISAEAGPITEKLLRAGITRVYATEETQLHRLSDELDVYIVDTPSGEELAIRLAERGAGQVVVLTDEADFFQVSEKLAGCGIITVPKPIDERAFWTALKTAEAAGNRYNQVINENQRLHRELEDIKVINRAKLLLVTRLSMTEPEAHRYIEKQAMDMRATKRAVAESILKTYEY